ncbi:hypothetical protein BSPWISOXPB_2498, partial [uncultured Gammaproteobacteria bacterium]
EYALKRLKISNEIVFASDMINLLKKVIMLTMKLMMNDGMTMLRILMVKNTLTK